MGDTEVNYSALPKPFQSTFLTCYNNKFKTKHKAKAVLRSRVLVVGDGGVGKTTMVCALQRLQAAKAGSKEDKLDEQGTTLETGYNPTFGVELVVVSIPLPTERDEASSTIDATVDLFLYGVCGSEVSNQGKLFYEKCYEDVDYIVYIYDALERSSLHNGWIQRVKDKNMIYGHRISSLVVANKIDLLEDDATSETCIPSNEGRRFANANGYRFFECSATEGDGVNEIFEYIARDTRSKKLEPEL